MHLLGIEEQSAFLVADESVVGKAVPQAGDDVIELPRPMIAFAMLHMLVHAEIQRRIRIGSSDDVPAGAAVADMIERGKPAGDVIGRVEGRRSGRDQADPLRHGRQRR